jgi:membrane protein YdbS with pleckstrin-like domain
MSHSTAPEGTAVGALEDRAVAWTMLPVGVIAYWQRTALIAVVPLFAISPAALALDAPSWIVVTSGVLAIGLGVVAWMAAPRRWRSWRYAVTERHVILSAGRWWLWESIVPRNRVLHVEIRRSPLHRALGLVALDLYTAGSIGGRLTIPALELRDAQALREQLLGHGLPLHAG